MFMELPVSGLHRLFHTGPTTSVPSRGREPAALDSVTEDAHTCDLLYPAFETLLNAQHLATLSNVDPSSASPSGNAFDESGIELGDARVLVAQDGGALSQGPRILYDSQLVGYPTSGAAGPGESKPTTRSRGSFVSQRHDRGVRSPSVDNEDHIETQERRASGEETDALLGCMFGTTGLPLVSSTKIHINQPTSPGHVWKAGSTPRSYEGSYRRASPRKHVPLNRSVTSDGRQIAGRSVPFSSPYSTDSAHKSMLITRVFAVDIKRPATVESGGHVASDGHESHIGLQKAKKEKVKQVKIPRFAVSLVLQIPRWNQRHDAVSLFSPRSVDDSSETAPNSGASNSDGDIERVTAHWNILRRVLSSLEAVAHREIAQLLSVVGKDSKQKTTQASESDIASSSGNLSKQKLKQSSQRILQLHTLALQGSASIANAAEQANRRISHAMNIRRVATNQGRWGVWREEARWVNAWMNGKRQDTFLFSLLTAFLGTHTEWIVHLGHPRTESRRWQQDTKEAQALRHRTVVVSTDKTITRRLIFLLSAFLPGTTGTSHSDKPIRPLSSRSSSGLSQSPPIGAPPSREVSLRRTINRRPRGARAPIQIHTHERSVSFSTPDSAMIDDQLDPLPGPCHIRRASDARSVRSLALPIPLGSYHSRKSSITTDSTPVPNPDVPVPFFSNLSSGMSGTSAAPRPGSSGSLASLSLQRTLSRSDSSAGAISPDSPTTSRWGSMLSGFWSARRGSSTEGTEGMSSSPDGLGIAGIAHSTSPRSPSKLSRMVEEAGHRPSITGESDQDTLQGPPSPGTITEATPARDIPERQSSEDFPLKLSIDTNDGVVDIDLPATKSYSSSFTSSIDSPQMANTVSSSFNEHSSLYGRTSTHSSMEPEIDPNMDVAGYLRRFHQDFTLQGVRPYQELKEEIKRSMRDEPTSNALPKSVENIDTCTTIVADTRDFSISRLSIRRKDTGESHFSEEYLKGLDPTLAEAVETVINQDAKNVPSRSRTTSPSRRRRTHSPLNTPHSESKQVILGALEEVVRSVTAEAKCQSKGMNINSDGNVKSAPVGNLLREGVRRWLYERAPR